MMKTAQAGFTLYQANRGVVHAAVRRLNVWPGHPDYDDLVEEGMLIYVAYYQHYRDPLRTKAAREKFNKLAGRFVYLDLLKQKKREDARPAIQAHSALQSLAGATDGQAELLARLEDVAMASVLPRLRSQLSPRERAVFEQVYDQSRTRAEVRDQLGLSQANLTNLLRRIYAKYQALAGEPAEAARR